VHLLSPSTPGLEVARPKTGWRLIGRLVRPEEGAFETPRGSRVKKHARWIPCIDAAWFGPCLVVGRPEIGRHLAGRRAA